MMAKSQNTLTVVCRKLSDMKIGGFQKFSLIDYPGLISAVIFTQGCNFRCPYCHNPELVLPDKFGRSIDSEYILDFLNSRTGKLDGVVLTGGEPTLQLDLLPFLRKIKELSFMIKLDTNGGRSEVIQNALAENLLDFIAMDIKAPLNSYSAVSGVEVDINSIVKSINLIFDSGVDYQFRTTIVPKLHTKKMVKELKLWMQSLQANHLFQDFVSSNILDPTIIYKRD